MAHSVARTSRRASTLASCALMSAGVGSTLGPAHAATAHASSPPHRPRHAAPRARRPGLVRPSKTMRGCLAWASAIRHAAVTPRAPPEATTTDVLPMLSAAAEGDGVSTDANVLRWPLARSPTSSVLPPCSNSVTRAWANSAAVRVPRARFGRLRQQLWATSAQRCAPRHSRYPEGTCAVHARQAKVTTRVLHGDECPTLRRQACSHCSAGLKRLAVYSNGLVHCGHRPQTTQKTTASASAGTLATTLAATPCWQ